MSGCEPTMFRKPRYTVVPWLLTTTVLTPGDKPIGTTKLIPSAGESPTKYRPAATPPTETDTPFNSTGSTGLRAVSDPPIAVLSELASPTVDLTTLSSPGERPCGSPGLGVGVGVGVGLAPGFALENGPMLLAPVKNDNTGADSVGPGGVSNRNTSVEPSGLPAPSSTPGRLNAIRLRVLLVTGRIPGT